MRSTLEGKRDQVMATGSGDPENVRDPKRFRVKPDKCPVLSDDPQNDYSPTANSTQRQNTLQLFELKISSSAVIKGSSKRRAVATIKESKGSLLKFNE